MKKIIEFCSFLAFLLLIIGAEGLASLIIKI